MSIKITTPNGGSDSLDFGCARTAIAATVTGTEVSSGEGKLELKTTTGGTSATKVTVLANGDVGIGTSPECELHVFKDSSGASTDGSAVAHFESSGSTVLQISAGTSSDAHIAFGDSGNQNIGSIAYLNNGNHMAFRADNGEKMRITGAGNVGINTAAPLAKLHVKVATNENLRIQAGSTVSDSGSVVMHTVNDADDSSVPMYLRASRFSMLYGNVGIGTLAPAQKLTTVGTASAGVLTPSLMVANSLASNDSVAGMCFHTRYDVNGTGFKAAIVLDGDNNSDATGDLKFLNSNEANITNPATIASHTRLVITKAGDLKFNSGYGSAATAYGCRAWVNFNGQGTLAIRDSANVSSVTDVATGNYRVNFTTAMPDVNYVSTGMAGGAGADQINVSQNFSTEIPAVGSCRYTIAYANGSAWDPIYVGIAIFR
mgnify:CR=1 FL=1